MEKDLKKLLKELKGKETSREEVIEVLKRQIEKCNDEIERFETGIKKDIEDGWYKNSDERKLQGLIEDEKNNILKKYNNEGNQLEKQLEETKQKNEEEKKDDYKKISTAIKDYHLDMVLEVNKQNKILSEIESERDGKLKEIDELIAQKEAERTHLMIKNRDFMDIEPSEAVADIRALGDDIETLKAQRDGVDGEYAPKLKAQSDTVKYCSQQKERASKFLGSIILSEKSIDEIYEILFGKEKKKEEQAEQNQEQQNQVAQSQVNQSQENQSQSGKSESEQVEVEQGGSKTEESKSFDLSKHLEPSEANQEEQEKSETSEEKKVESNPTERDSKNIFSYRFSAQGISYAGKFIDRVLLLKWYNKDKAKIESTLKSVLGEKEQFEDFLEYSDKFAYLSMIYRGSKDVNGELILDDETKFRLNEYYDVWTNPEKQEKSNMLITYDLKNTSGIARLFKKTKFTKEQIDAVKENAFLLRKRKDVKIEHGFFSRIEFYIKEKIESFRGTKLLEEGEGNSRKQNSPSWLLTEEELEKASVPVKESEKPEKEPEKENEEVR